MPVGEIPIFSGSGNHPRKIERYFITIFCKQPPKKIEKYVQWEFQDPKMEVLYHIRPYFVGIFPYIGLI